MDLEDTDQMLAIAAVITGLIFIGVLGLFDKKTFEQLQRDASSEDDNRMNE